MLSHAKKIALGLIAGATALSGYGTASADSPPPKPEITIREGNAFGVAPVVILTLPKGRQIEFKGPDLHPQVQPSFNGGSVSVTIPWPQGKK